MEGQLGDVDPSAVRVEDKALEGEGLDFGERDFEIPRQIVAETMEKWARARVHLQG